MRGPSPLTGSPPLPPSARPLTMNACAPPSDFGEPPWGFARPVVFKSASNTTSLIAAPRSSDLILGAENARLNQELHNPQRRLRSPCNWPVPHPLTLSMASSHGTPPFSNREEQGIHRPSARSEPALVCPPSHHVARVPMPGSMHPSSLIVRSAPFGRYHAGRQPIHLPGQPHHPLHPPQSREIWQSSHH
jgi:hypothetical protein